ncbi:Ribosomal protein S18 acetylase RimI [Marivirga sericea]|uniref:Ribosomal protein S18 acetylase RimI n=1 Tax=Marivirga sericea TaxID=1028 RepID=A0A1X7JL47_9BACT|nr:GNAT family N-acetyltransferase [Marivirga sericea]SMG28922.1 Ribosomal protein S18 acetylase RimI [Marivirga sericea]
MMEIKTLEDVDRKEILKVFNESFSDYLIPFQLSQEQLALKMLADKTDLMLSVGVFENSHLIGFILHGFDEINNEKVIYNGGTGVIPKKRGSELTKQMYRFILPILKENKIDKLQLEVISENIPAIHSYKKCGYETKRELVCYKGEIMISQTNEKLSIEKLRYYDWDLMQSFWSTYPSWQSSKNVINDLNDSYISLGAYLENLLVGYVIYNSNNNRIQQIAISSDFRRKLVASTLIMEIIETYGNKLSFINVDKRFKPINTFLQKIGFRSYLEQIEMELHLA